MTAYPRMATRAAAAAALVLLAACTTVGPDYRVPGDAVVKRPAAAAPFRGAGEAPFSSEPLPAHWWRLYHDPVLDALVDKALAANADLRVAAANLRRAHAELEQVEERKRPEVEMQAAPAYGRVAGTELGIPETLPAGGLYTADIRVRYQLDLFGRIARAIEAAAADRDAAQAAADVARVTVAADTARSYAEACAAGYQLEVASHSVELQQEFVKLTAQQVTLGRGIALDTSRARAQLEQLRAALPPLQARRRTALYRLAVLTGEVPANFPQEVAQCATVPRLTAAVPVGDGAALLRRRPDIRQAERTLAGASARIGVATADLYPDIRLGASVGSIGTLRGAGESNTWHFALGPLISWSLPDTSGARARIAQAEAGTAAALARFDGVVLNSLRETESALTVYARELDRNAALVAARDQSALAASQAGKLYQYGRTDFFTKLDAERTLASADSAVAASSAQLALDQVAVFLALGGGWESAPGQRGQPDGSPASPVARR